MFINTIAIFQSFLQQSHVIIICCIDWHCICVIASKTYAWINNVVSQCIFTPLAMFTIFKVYMELWDDDNFIIEPTELESLVKKLHNKLLLKTINGNSLYTYSIHTYIYTYSVHIPVFSKHTTNLYFNSTIFRYRTKITFNHRSFFVPIRNVSEDLRSVYIPTEIRVKV